MVSPSDPAYHPTDGSEPQNPALARYATAAEVLTGRRLDGTHAMVAEALDSWLEELEEQLRLPGLAELGLSAADHDAVVEAAMKGSSMKGNPITLTREELAGILRDAA